MFPQRKRHPSPKNNLETLLVGEKVVLMLVMEERITKRSPVIETRCLCVDTRIEEDYHEARNSNRMLNGSSDH